MKQKLRMILIVLACILTQACSVGDGDTGEMQYYTSNTLQNSKTGIFDGEWTVNRTPIDTARLVATSRNMCIRLPEAYLMEQFFVDQGYQADAVVTNQPQWIYYTEQGYSEVSQFYTLAGTGTDGAASLSYIPSNYWGFCIAKGGKNYFIKLYMTGECFAVYNNTLGQWTLSVVVRQLQIKDMDTQEQYIQRLPQEINIVYHTKKKIG